ncbi:ABC-type Mn2+/Zn2+ transport systems permease component [Rubrobacter radiotolerans]|uniref:ABC-type Mn2+/Zn2+ transport systems permease component n=1 Tax=Rubrobacter radiotolerans TaxID=42256 RepID=A0A023X2X6_RUBRA|nr:metal ABC transporter permease [Rubrobacter radiotolerans]AHY46419.1 ABC-type Mn2+/Zn2+ transport systems permease component [Rubrobacter radiotolerans]MDX5893826.1 metal ABC transporter permease [Rubrobacter radiotolerans]SMC04575.1 manganese/iron transport system permease protein [Rubrobacter radiotolerans DSM 5868]
MLQALAEPWTQGIMQRALAEVVLIGLVGGALGCWIVFYELSYSAESLAHALFPGLVLAALFGFPLILGGGAGLVLAALAIAVFGRAPHIGRDTSVAVVISALFGFGVVLALSPDSPPGLQELLFGEVLAVTNADLLLAALLAGAVLLGLFFLHRQLLVVGFDRATARSVGARPRFTDLALMGLLALATLVAIQGLGNLLVVAVLVGPAATARLLSKRMFPMMVLATVLAVACGVSGLYLSYYAGLAAGASIAGSIVVLYVVVASVTGVLGRLAPRSSGAGTDDRSGEGARV